MSNQMSIFDFFGGDEAEIVEGTSTGNDSAPAGKNGTKKNANAAGKKDSSRAKKAAMNPKYKLPVNIMYLPGRAATITGEGELLADELLAKAEESVPGINSRIFNSIASNAGSYIPKFFGYNCKAKGKVKITDSTKIYGPDFTEVSHDAFVENDPLDLAGSSAEVDISDIIKAVRDSYGDDYKDIPLECAEARKGTDTTDLFVFFRFTNASEIKTYKAPEAMNFTLSFPTKANIPYTGKDGLLIEEIAREFDCDKENLLLYKLADDKFFVALNYVTGPAAAVQSEKKYKVEEGTILSLTFKEYAVTPADFDGKTEVTHDDIKKFLVNKGHRDYGIAEFVVDVFEKDKLILATIKGSKKGSVYHPLFASDEAGIAHLEDGIPKIPTEAVNFFAQMAKENASVGEMLLELFYEPAERKYFFIYPVQTQAIGSVISKSDPFFEHPRLSGLIKVGEFHSHGRISAFFSDVDNADERFRAGLYGVIGDVDSDEPSFRFRFSYGNGIFDEMTKEGFINRLCSPDTVFGNSMDYTECLTSDINRRSLRFCYNSEKDGWLMEIGRHEVNTLSNVPGLTVRPVAVGDRICYGVRLTGRTVCLKHPWVENFMDMYKSSEQEEQGYGKQTLIAV